jgi:hypothetical protein
MKAQDVWSEKLKAKADDAEKAAEKNPVKKKKEESAAVASA